MDGRKGACTLAGFREIGRRRQAKFMAGKLWDIVYMDCLSTEFVSPILSRILVPDELRFQAELEQGEVPSHPLDISR
jgi:hypothetical protein